MATKSLCSVSGCGKKHYAKLFCRNHYHRFTVHGDPLAGKARPGEPLEWLKEHAAFAGEECLLWPFARFPNGYASIVVEGITTHAARVMCIEANGSPDDMTPFALHSCNRGHDACVHPQHLRWGTQEENMLDSIAAGTRCRGEAQHAAKLTEADVRTIRQLRGSASQQAIADRYGLNAETVGRIQRRQAWAWLE